MSQAERRGGYGTAVSVARKSFWRHDAEFRGLRGKYAEARDRWNVPFVAIVDEVLCVEQRPKVALPGWCVVRKLAARLGTVFARLLCRGRCVQLASFAEADDGFSDSMVLISIIVHLTDSGRCFSRTCGTHLHNNRSLCYCLLDSLILIVLHKHFVV